MRQFWSLIKKRLNELKGSEQQMLCSDALYTIDKSEELNRLKYVYETEANQWEAQN